MKLKIYLSAMIVILCAATLFTSASCSCTCTQKEYTQLWVTRYDRSNNIDNANDLCLDQSKNVYITGSSVGDNTSHDFITIKYNSDGVEQWVAIYDGPAHDRDVANSITIDASGNVYVTGPSAGINTYYDYATIKYDNNGVEQWVSRYAAPGAGNDSPYIVVVDASGNVYVTGASVGGVTLTMFDFATVKYDSNGAEQWVARYNGPGNGEDSAHGLVIDNSGNVYVAGASIGIGTSRDMTTIKYNNSGVEQWVSRYDGSASGADVILDMTMDDAGNIYVFGTSSNIGTDNDYCTIKYNSDGVKQWVAVYNGPTNDSDVGAKIDVDKRGNVYVTGTSEDGCTTVKYNSNGVEQWSAHFDHLAIFYQSIDLVADNSGYVYVSGGFVFDNENYAIIKYDNNGVEQWVAIYDGPANDTDRAQALVVDNLGYIYVTGGSVGTDTDFDCCTIKYWTAKIIIEITED